MNGKSLKDWRKSRGMTQFELATALGVGKSTISMWETGERMPSLDMAKKVAAFFGTIVDLVFFNTFNHESRLKVYQTYSYQDKAVKAMSEGKSQNVQYAQIVFRQDIKNFLPNNKEII